MNRYVDAHLFVAAVHLSVVDAHLSVAAHLFVVEQGPCALAVVAFQKLASYYL